MQLNRYKNNCMQTLQHALTLEHKLSVEYSQKLGHEQSSEHVHVQILVTQYTIKKKGKNEKMQIYR